MKVCRRIEFDFGWYFTDPLPHFENIEIIDCSRCYEIIKFTYKGKNHKIRVREGKYGKHFNFGTTYYVLGESES